MLHLKKCCILFIGFLLCLPLKGDAKNALRNQKPESKIKDETFRSLQLDLVKDDEDRPRNRELPSWSFDTNKSWSHDGNWTNSSWDGDWDGDFDGFGIFAPFASILAFFCG